MVDRPTSTFFLALLLLALSPRWLAADPSQTALLSPVFSLSGRLGDPEHMVNPLDVPDSISVPANRASDAEEFASGEPGHYGEARGSVMTGSNGVGFLPAADDSHFSSGDPESAIDLTDSELRDLRDTLIRSEQDSRVYTFAGEGGERLPDSWAAPPGSSVPGGYPGYRRGVASLDYSGISDPGYFPPPSIENSYRGSSSAYPVSGSYHPGGPYAYRYEGMAPLGDPQYFDESGFEFDGGFPLFTEQFDSESAHLKAGPFYFQALWVESGVLYSDYNGPTTFAPGQEDGWLGYSSFAFQIAARLNPSLYLTVDGEIIYVYGTNELGFRSGLSGGPFASIRYETQLGAWDIRAFADFGTGSLQNAFGSEAFDQAGRYSFGFLGRYDDGLLYDPSLYTRVGVEATTLVDPDWRLTLTADHSDYWYFGDDQVNDHSASEHAGVRLGAEPGSVPFSPWFSYDLFSDDYFETAYHTVYAGGSGRLSQNVFFDGRVGYFWESSDLPSREHWLWSIGLSHRINERTTHGIRVGQDFFMSDFSVDSTVSSFFQYYVTHEITKRLRLHAYAQWSTDEFLTGPLVGGEYESEIYGVWLHNDFTDRLTGSLGYLEESRRSTQSGYEFERSIFQARLDISLGERTSAYFLYQHEDTDIYYEDLYMTGVRRSF